MVDLTLLFIYPSYTAIRRACGCHSGAYFPRWHFARFWLDDIVNFCSEICRNLFFLVDLTRIPGFELPGYSTLKSELPGTNFFRVHFSDPLSTVVHFIFQIRFLQLYSCSGVACFLPCTFQLAPEGASFRWPNWGSCDNVSDKITMPFPVFHNSPPQPWKSRS